MLRTSASVLWILSWLLSGVEGYLHAQDSLFVLRATSLRNYVAPYLGNGNFSVVGTPSGIAPARSYMIWITEHHPDDVARNACLPAWNSIDYFNGTKWLSAAFADTAAIAAYNQTLDMYNGVLLTSCEWREGSTVTDIRTRTFVSRANPNLAAVEFVIVPRKAGRVSLTFPIIPWPEPKRLQLAKIADIKVNMVNGLPDVWYPGHMRVVWRAAQASATGGLCSVTAQPFGDTSIVAIVVNSRWSGDLAHPKITTDTIAGSLSLKLSFDAEGGKTYQFHKIVGIVSSRQSQDPLAEAQNVVASSPDFEDAFEEHRNEWHRLWQTDVQVEGDPTLQRVIRSSMFYLLCSAREQTGYSISPMGLSSDGYYGHIFWDADTWMFPPLLLTHPDIARSMVMFRYHVLPAAQANAKLNGYSGAMYPWESDENGNEATPQFAYQNALYENHVTGDVAFAQWQYFLATGDTAWLVSYGYPVIKETADFWVGRSSYDAARNRYNINNVVSVDEGLIGVNNDAYTNLVARRNLEIATTVASLVGRNPDPRWKDVAERLYIPYDSVNHCYLTYENAKPQSLGSVVPLLYYPLELDVADSIKRNDLINALAFTKRTGGGVMMGITLYAIVAAEIRDKNLFNEFHRLSYTPYLRGSFNVLAEAPDNMSTNFLTGAGGLLQQVIFGYTGLRLGHDGLVRRFQPMLPDGVKEVRLTNVKLRGKRFDITVSGTVLTISERK